MYDNQMIYPISIMANILKVSRAAFYKWEKNGKKQINAKIDPVLREMVNKVFKSSFCNYGRQRIKIALEKAPYNIVTTESKISTIMKLDGLIASKTGRPLDEIKEEDEDKVKDGKFANLLKDLNIIRPKQVLVTDITEITIPDLPRAWLCTFRDPFNGEIKGYKYGFNQKTSLVKEALEQALANFNIWERLGLIIHSDNGKQFLEVNLQDSILQQNIRWSNSRTYKSTDNAFAETWYSSMKTEFLNKEVWKNYDYLFYKLDQYIKWYNEERIITRLKTSPKKYIKLLSLL